MARDEFDLKIIRENLAEIRKTDDVNIISTYRVKSDRIFSTSGLGYALCAIKNGGEFIQLTKERSPMTYPIDPIYWFSKEVGGFYMSDFVEAGTLGGTLINKNNFKDFVIVPDEDNNKFVSINVSFNDGKTYQIDKARKSMFNEEKYTKLGEEIKTYQENYKKELGIKDDTENNNEDTINVAPYVPSESEDTFNNLTDLGFEDELETF